MRELEAAEGKHTTKQNNHGYYNNNRNDGAHAKIDRSTLAPRSAGSIFACGICWSTVQESCIARISSSSGIC